MAKYAKPLLFALVLLPVAIVAGIFVGLYQLDSYSDEIIAQVVQQLGSVEILIVIVAIQTVGYALFCGFFGYILADKIGLWKPVEFEKRRAFVALIVSVLGGVILALDYWTFGNFIEGIKESNAAGPTLSGVIASVLYGGIIEEVMMRLFFMSLIAFFIWKLFFGKCEKESIPSSVFVIANIISALLFAAVHLPATISIFGTLTPLIVFRCFLLNGGFGLVFGELYRKYGIVYAMMSHAVFHIVNKLGWLVFI